MGMTISTLMRCSPRRNHPMLSSSLQRAIEGVPSRSNAPVSASRT
ncbi:hypothetical protein LCAUCD174_0003 [Lacticaseibacillus paracasei]|nr:hypothetical protein LCAUCD174_0003 [Lacticaseibacillus paracasei]